MAKYTVEEIKEEAYNTFQNCKGKRGTEKWHEAFSIWTIREFASKVLFLCKEIEKLQKNK